MISQHESNLRFGLPCVRVSIPRVMTLRVSSKKMSTSKPRILPHISILVFVASSKVWYDSTLFLHRILGFTEFFVGKNWESNVTQRRRAFHKHALIRGPSKFLFETCHPALLSSSDQPRRRYFSLLLDIGLPPPPPL